MTTVKAREAAGRVVAVCDVLAEIVRGFAAFEAVWRTVTQDVPPLRRYLFDTVIPELGI